MLLKIQIFRGFDKNQSYGLLSMYLYRETIHFSLDSITNVMIYRSV
jgi:hypothetical protein